MPPNLIYRPYTLEQFAIVNFYQSSKNITENKIATTINKTNYNFTESCSLNYKDQNISSEEIQALPALHDTKNTLLAPIPLSNHRSIMMPLTLPYLFNHNG